MPMPPPDVREDKRADFCLVGRASVFAGGRLVPAELFSTSSSFSSSESGTASSSASVSSSVVLRQMLAFDRQIYSARSSPSVVVSMEAQTLPVSAPQTPLEDASAE